jgi:hypothetical protein
MNLFHRFKNPDILSVNRQLKAPELGAGGTHTCTHAQTHGHTRTRVGYKAYPITSNSWSVTNIAGTLASKDNPYDTYRSWSTLLILTFLFGLKYFIYESINHWEIQQKNLIKTHIYVPDTYINCRSNKCTLFHLLMDVILTPDQHKGTLLNFPIKLRRNPRLDPHKIKYNRS